MVIKFQRGRGYTNSHEYVYSWHLISFHLIFIVKQHIHSVSGLASCFKPHQADIDINKRVVYICIYVYMSFCLPGYLRHFKSIWRVWGIVGTVLARVSTIGTETKTETKQNQAKVKDRAKTMFLVDFVLQWIFSYQKACTQAQETHG